MLEELIRKAVKKHKLSGFVKLLEERLDVESLEQELESVVCAISPEEAEHIVHQMHPYGEKWARSEIRSFIASKGVPESECVHYYLVMNAMFNDHRDTGQRYGMDKPDFYFALAKEFIDDVDGKPYKVERYFDD